MKFPKRKTDDAFVVFARFSGADPQVIALARDYVKAWMRANSSWTRIWRSNVIREETLEYSMEFLSEPRVEHVAGENSFAVVFEGRATAKMWKDWLVFFVSDFEKIFPEVRFDRFEST